jgi:uncharacterized membrane protein
MIDGPTKATDRLPPPPAAEPSKARVLGVDVARGIALISMFAAHTFAVMGDDGRPTLAVMTVVGRSATLFVMVAGISLAFLTGGQRLLHAGPRRAAAAGLAVRALLIGVIGLALGYVTDDLWVILPYYGLFFLLAIPLISLRPLALAGIATALTVVGPLLEMAEHSLDLPAPFIPNPTLTSPFVDPIGFVVELFVSGGYPAGVYMAYLCVGMAIGRLDLSSTKVAARLLGGGLALAVTAWVTSSVLLFRLGGLQHLQAAAGGETDPTRIRDKILWDPEQVESWWWLALRGHHSGTPIDMLHTVGVAMAIVGAALLVTKLPAARRLLWPLGVVGSMTLTIYSAHAVALNLDDLLDVDDLAFYLLQITAAVIFAVVWQRFRGQGPLERLVAKPAGLARRAVTARLEGPSGGAPTAPRPGCSAGPRTPR